MFRSESVFSRDASQFSRQGNNKARWFRKLLILVMLSVAGWQFGHGAWIQVKAHMAQILIEKAWQRSLQTEQPVLPWGWADTWPIAKLNFPEFEQQLFVLAGSTEAIMAFGPGHLVQSAFPGQPGNSVLIGHKDTHFKILKDIKKGQLLEVETQHGATLYKIENIRIAHESQVDLIEKSSDPKLTLITRYPFDAVEAGTKHRLIVTAVGL